MSHTTGKLVVSGTSLVTDDDKYCIAVIEDDGGYQAPSDQREANAARLAHCWNTHDELVEALRKARCAIQGYKDTNKLADDSVLNIALVAAKAALSKEKL